LPKNNFAFIDAQQPTDHLKDLGAETISRKDFLELLKESLKKETLQSKWTGLSVAEIKYFPVFRIL
jgi:leucyl/phenylalanyl-tRNA--protein transferase